MEGIRQPDTMKMKVVATRSSSEGGSTPKNRFRSVQDLNSSISV